MSGVFWEADKQPNLAEAATSFTLSTLNLAVAIPMTLVDGLVSVTMFITSMLMIVLGPVLEQVGVLVNMLMELVGLESWTGYNTIISILVITTIHDICKVMKLKYL